MEPIGSGVVTVGLLAVIVVPPVKPKLTKLASNLVLEVIVVGRS